MALPALVIAAVQSGSGKTSFTLALARSLARRGLKVQTFKVGPDFLDPTYLALASGRPCHNLDGWMAGPEHCRRLFARAAAEADCALVEGVMGLFDGADAASDEGSTAQIARLLSAPLILVANTHGMGRSFAALVKGFTTFAPDLAFAGIVANHCGSEGHAALLSDALAAAGLPPLLGAIPRGAFPELASRHLGLLSADGKILPEALLDRFADALEERLRPESLFPDGLGSPLAEETGQDKGEGRAAAAARGAGPPVHRGHRPASPAAAGRKPRDPVPRALRIGIARDAAFHFYYADLFEALTAAGAEPVFFSPLEDSRLPAGLSGLYLGGGYPELHAERLAANTGMLGALRAFADSGRPLYAECGGLICLSRGIEAGGNFFPLAGILPARTRLLSGKRALGYAEVTLQADSLWGRRGETLRGHEFHYSELIEDPAADPAWKRVYAVTRRRTGAVEAEGFQRGSVLASYLHLHLASRPAAVARFIEQCGGET
jgi:cobyrinic acid a,c-diamide synthase